jgi:hypothetical protein
MFPALADRRADAMSDENSPKNGDKRVVKDGNLWRYEEYASATDEWITLSESGLKRMHDMLWAAHNMHRKQAAESTWMADECERLVRQVMAESELG